VPVDRIHAVCGSEGSDINAERRKEGEFDCIDSNVKSASLVSYMFLRSIGMASAFDVDFFGREGVSIQNLKAQH